MGNLISSIDFYWNTYRFEILVCVSILIFILLAIFDRKYSKYEGLSSLKNKRKPILMKHESRCRKIMEDHYKTTFNKIYKYW